MNTIVLRIILVITGYAFGLIQSGYYYGRLHGMDIREYGSGNVGATNSLRVLGPKAGALVLACDFLKAFVPVLIVGIIWKNDPLRFVLMIYTGLGVMLGHNFPVQLHFKGGKGVASTAGMLFAIDWRLGVILVVIFAIITLTTRLVSLASITVMMLFIIAVLLFSDKGMEFSILVIIICGMSIIRHASNIERLLKGTEKQI